MQYQCNSRFTSLNTYRTYSVGTVIEQDEFNRLTLKEQLAFDTVTDKDDDADDVSGTLTGMPDLLSDPVYSAFTAPEPDFSQPQPDNNQDSFGGMGGGDTGGGGADGNW